MDFYAPVNTSSSSSRPQNNLSGQLSSSGRSGSDIDKKLLQMFDDPDSVLDKSNDASEQAEKA